MNSLLRGGVWIWQKGGAACFFGEGCVCVLLVWFGWVFFLSFLLYSSGTLKILGSIPLQTYSRSAKRL